MDPNILERKERLQQYLQTVAVTVQVCTSEIFQDFLKSAVLSRHTHGGTNLSQEKMSRKRSQRVLRGRSKEGSELGPIKSVYSLLADFLDRAAPLPCQQLNTFQVTSSSHPSRGASQRGEWPGDSRLHPAISLDKEELSELDNPAQISPVGSVGSGCPLRGAELWDPPPDHTPSHNSLCDEEGEEGLTFGSKEPEVTPAPRGPEFVSGGVGGSGATPSAEGSETAACTKGSESATSCPVSLADGGVPHEVTTAGAPPSGAWPHVGGWQESVDIMRRYLHILQSGMLAFLHTLFMGTRPLTHERVKQLTEDLETRMPFSNGLLSLATEAARLECPETCALGEAPQVGALSVVGGVVDRFLWKMLHEVVYCENTWARALYSLRNKLWPRGVFLREDRPQLSEEQRKDQVNMAVKSLKKFLPDALPYVVGSEAYDGALRHCLECLQNKRINKHFILRVMDHLVIEVFPELKDKDFQRQLTRLRSTAGPGRKAARL